MIAPLHEAAAGQPVPGQPVLQVRKLCKHYPVFSKGLIRKRIGTIKACDDVTFDLMPGETLGIVGESGSGKTTTARAILRATKPSSGQVLFRTADRGSVDLATLHDRA
jgi:oligopeptide transport system ATP-binding protein